MECKMYLRASIGLFFVVSCAAVGVSPPNHTRPVILPVVDANDIRFIRVSFGTFRKQPAYNRVHAITQDSKGFLWFATQDRFQRYDGYEVREYPDDPNSQNAVYTEESLFIDRRNTLWAGWESGLDRFDLDTESIERYPRKEPFTTRVISTIEDRAGILWFSADNGLIRMDPATGRTIRYQHDPGDPASLSNSKVRAAFEAKDGTFWIATTAGVDLFDRRTGNVVRHIDLPADLPGTDPNPELQTSFLEDHAGVLWMAFSFGYGLARVNREAGTLTYYSLDGTGKDNTVQAGARAIIELPDGTLWIGTTSSGILKLNRERTRFTRYRNNPADPDSLSGDQVHGLFLDREGNMWAGTNGAGVNRFSPRPSPFKVYQHRIGDPNSLDMNYTTSIFEDRRGLLWIGSLKALGRLDRRTGKMTFYRKAGGPGELSSTWVVSMAEDRSGRLWFGTVGAGVNRLDRRTGIFKVFRHDPADPHSLSHDTAQAIVIDHKGTLWVGTEDGLNEFDEATQSFRVYKAGRGRNESRVDQIAEDAHGALWIATQATSLVRFDPKSHEFTSFRHTSDPRSLSNDMTNSVCIASDGIIWVGTQNGLNRFDPRTASFTRFYERDGLAGSDISKILEDESRILWVSTSKGLSRFDPRDKTSKNYYISDGIAGNEFYNYASAFRSKTGEMFFSSYAGVTAFFPRDVTDNPYVPPVAITDLRVGGKPLPIGGDSPLGRAIPFTRSIKLAYDRNLVSLQFSALSFMNPDGNRYQYRMERLENSWNESDSGQRFITYSLAPGNYVFRVKGSNSRGIWNEPGTSLQIEILPPWWSTAWFRAMAALAILASLAGAYYLRLQSIEHRFSLRLEARVAERARIARELHDTLLQSFQASLIRMQAARNIFDRRPEKAVEGLDAAITMAAGAVAEGRSAIQNLRVQPAGGGDLAQLLTAAGQEMARSEEAPENPPVFRLTVEGERRDLQPLLQDEVYRITRELLRNAYRHAQAGRIEVEIRYESRHLRVHVRDDGKGIDAEILKAGGRTGHWGLPGMRERVDRFGGKLEFWSEAGAGTEAVLTVPAAAAYANSNGGAFSFLRRKLWIHER